MATIDRDYRARASVLLALAAVGALIGSAPVTVTAADTTATTSTTATTTASNVVLREAPPRALDACTGNPKFLPKFGATSKALVDTTSAQVVGLSLIDVDQRGEYSRRATHPSWSIAGDLGRVQRDAQGHVYTYPAPGVTLVRNPVSKSNIVYRVDTDTGIMAPFVELPKEVPESTSNPFGLLAMTLDCEQNALYAASVYGSTAGSERGIIARIDLTSKAVTVVKRNIDALSLLLVRRGGEKRLLTGSARSGLITSHEVNPDGSLRDQEQLEIDLGNLGQADDRKVRSMRLDATGTLTVRVMPFNFTLLPRNQEQFADLRFRPSVANGPQSPRWQAMPALQPK